MSLRVADWRAWTSHEIDGLSEHGDVRLLDRSPDGAWLAVRETVGRTELWRARDLLDER